MIPGMTRLFVAGHSDSGTAFLPDGVLPWPERTRAWVAAGTGEPCELSEVRFAAMGSRAVDYLVGAVEKAEPDIVILPLTGFVIAVGTVAESVRARFGPRAARLFLASEARFQGHTREGRLRRSANRAARKAARRVLGTRPLSTVEQTTAIFEEIMDRLARRESTQVVVVRDVRFSKEVQEREPRVHERFDRMEARLLAVAARHHFVVADLEGAISRAPDRDVFYQDDGVHTTAAFHDVYFQLMQEAVGQVLATRA